MPKHSRGKECQVKETDPRAIRLRGTIERYYIIDDSPPLVTMTLA